MKTKSKLNFRTLSLINELQELDATELALVLKAIYERTAATLDHVQDFVSDLEDDDPSVEDLVWAQHNLSPAVKTWVRVLEILDEEG